MPPLRRSPSVRNAEPMTERPGAAHAEPTAFALELPSDVRLIDTAVSYLVSRCR